MTSKSTPALSENSVDVVPTESYGWQFLKKWCLTSESTLIDAESTILQNLREIFTTRYVDVGSVVGNANINIWTLSMNEDKRETPLVLIHGLCSGLALWALNLDELSRLSNRPVYAIDIPGFGRSTRPAYSDDPVKVEKQLVEIIETWRIKMNLERMILVGHSFGGFLSFSYSLTYPKRVSHLICADPWGFSKKPADLADLGKIPFHHRMVAKLMDYLQVNPMGPIRFLGYLGGPLVILSLRGKDLIQHFSNLMSEPHKKVTNYLFHCNAQNPTGESAFTTMMSTFGWAKNPMHLRINELDTNIPLTLIYGSRSWIDHFSAEAIATLRSPSYVDYHILNSGHHVYAETAMEFNTIILKVCSLSLTSQE